MDKMMGNHCEERERNYVEEIPRRRRESEGEFAIFTTFITITVIFFVVCFLRIALDFAYTKMKEELYGPQKEVCWKLKNDNNCDGSTS